MSSFFYALIAICCGYLFEYCLIDYADAISRTYLEELPEKTNSRLKIFLCVIASILFGAVIFIFSIGIPSIFLFTVCLILICCFFTDCEYGLLPDELTLSLVWIGLVGSLFPVLASPEQAILGAIVGYGFFWLSNQVFLFFKGTEGMYPGDFKLNAGIGACVGLNLLVPVIAIAFLFLLVIAFSRFICSSKSSTVRFLETEIPYGCYASIVTIFFLMNKGYQLYSTA